MKVLVVGLDGCDFTIADPLLERGEMKNLASLISRGARANLRTTIPPVSSSAWGAFMTGMGPGGTGVFSFCKTGADGYEFQSGDVLDSAPFRGRCFWDAAGNAGIRIAAITVPATFPAWRVNGVMVSGFPSPAESEKCFYPESATAWAGGPVNLPHGFDTDFTEEESLVLYSGVADNTLRLCLSAIEKTDPEIMVVVFSEIDKVQHDFMKYREADHPGASPEARNKMARAIDEAYIQADARLGSLMEKVPASCHVILMSDHGGAPAPRRFLHLNAWLAERGMFSLSQGDRASKSAELIKNYIRSKIPEKHRRMAKDRFGSGSAVRTAWQSAGGADWTKTKAFWAHMHVPGAGILINLKGRQPHGIVEPGKEYDELRREIVDGLLAVTDPRTGEKPVSGAWLREEIYRGNLVDTAPDIALEFRNGWRAGYNNRPPSVMVVPERALKTKLGRGTHSMNGVLAVSGPGIEPGIVLPTCNIIDIAPTICYLAGLPVPSNFEGNVIDSIFKIEYIEKNPFSSGPPLAGLDDGGVLSYDETESMKEKLSGFGYL